LILNKLIINFMINLMKLTIVFEYIYKLYLF